MFTRTRIGCTSTDALQSANNFWYKILKSANMDCGTQEDFDKIHTTIECKLSMQWGIWNVAVHAGVWAIWQRRNLQAEEKIIFGKITCVFRILGRKMYKIQELQFSYFLLYFVHFDSFFS